MSALIRGVTSGHPAVVARYYTLIPYEDDSRQRAFLDAVSRAGLSVIVKRLPPKGVNRQVAVDLEMAADIVAYALGHVNFSAAHEYQPGQEPVQQMASPPTTQPFVRLKLAQSRSAREENQAEVKAEAPAHKATLDSETSAAQRSVVVVCPSRELSYPIGLVKELGVDTTTADFGQFNTGDILKSASKWIDLSDSETIWRD